MPPRSRQVTDRTPSDGQAPDHLDRAYGDDLPGAIEGTRDACRALQNSGFTYGALDLVSTPGRDPSPQCAW